MSAGACDACLRRSWLVARLGGAIELARHRRQRLREILALADETLIAALGAWAGEDLAGEHDRFDPDELRVASAGALVEAVCRHDPCYPGSLGDLVDAPVALFVVGGVRRLVELVGPAADGARRVVSVVGTRRASEDGLEVARGLGRGLGAAGVTVVSGMALGVDSAAHAGALEVGGPTVAVLAGGADVPYPASKRALYRQIAAAGCVVSEMPPGFVPFRWCFPARNRTIAALGEMTIVVEAAARSGSLITAEIAADLGREVAAVPGPVSAWRARGTNALLRDGATLIRDARDALDAVVGVDHEPLIRVTATLDAALEPRLRSILAAVADGRDTVAALAGAPDQARPVLSALTELELLGRLRRGPGGRYLIVSPW